MEPELKRRAQTFEDVIAMLRQAMPELEASPIRLPTPVIATAVVDPDATNALPVLRASDRPPAAAPIMGDTIPGMAPMTQSASIPPGAVPYPGTAPSGSSWQTPNTSYASVSMAAPKKRNPAWLVAAGAALVIGGIGIGAVVAARPHPGPAVAAAGAPEAALANATSAVTTTSAEQTTPAPSNEPPTVSVDALPKAAGAGAVRRGSGRLSLAASPGWCTITIDGTDRGPTPIAAVDLPAGPHQISCKPQNGKQRVASVVIQDGATSKYRFALDD